MSVQKELSSRLQLARPSVNLFSRFLEFVEDMRANGQPLWAPYLPKEDEAPGDFIERLLKRETEPESPFVPETVFWAVYDENVVGRISLRHRLEGNLLKNGGNIGYEVSPKWRKRGFATEMLRQVLLTPKAIEIGQVLLTCAPNNEASNRTIQRNGGVFERKIFVDFLQEERNHYWIDCRSPQSFIQPQNDQKMRPHNE